MQYYVVFKIKRSIHNVGTGALHASCIRLKMAFDFNLNINDHSCASGVG